MNKFVLVFLGALSVMDVSSAAAAGLGKVVTKLGDWTIYREQDAMTDAVSCVATYKATLQIQLTVDSLAVSLRGRGGVSSYRYRLDNNPPGELHLANDIEKETSAIVIDGDNFTGIIAAQRIRIEFLTILDTIVDEDIDLHGSRAAITYMQGPNCKSP
jgi:hypothetical protein